MNVSTGCSPLCTTERSGKVKQLGPKSFGVMVPGDAPIEKHVLVSPKLLLEFVKALVQNVNNGDTLLFAFDQAAKESGASEGEMETLKKAVLNESKKGFNYPEGFMP